MSTPTLSPTSTAVSASSSRSIKSPRQQQRHCCPSSHKFATPARASVATSPVQAQGDSTGVIAAVDRLAAALASSSINLIASNGDEQIASGSAGSSGSSNCKVTESTSGEIPKVHRPPSLSGPPSPPDSETDKQPRTGGVAALPPLIKPRRRLNRATHRRLSLNHQRQKSLPPPPPPPPTAVPVHATPPQTPKHQPADANEAPVSDAEVVEVRTTKKIQGKVKGRRVVLPRLPNLAYAMPGRNGKTWQETICCIEPLGACVSEQAPGSSFCTEHTCRGVNDDHTGCTNPVYNPRKTRFCALGYHRETGRTDQLHEALMKGKERSVIRLIQRDAEFESASAWFDENFGAIVNFRGDGPDPACPATPTPIAQHHSRLDLTWGPYSTCQDRYWQGEWRGPWSLSPMHWRPAASRSTSIPMRVDGGRSA